MVYSRIIVGNVNWFHYSLCVLFEDQRGERDGQEHEYRRIRSFGLFNSCCCCMYYWWAVILNELKYTALLTQVTHFCNSNAI
mmetsp:Transcript_8787/g.13277  ORF Transcript_8787/g.13277 Transcript_8787/m.13277 type:complete len:82 (+) Transcript_8787:1143-1388(+)